MPAINGISDDYIHAQVKSGTMILTNRHLMKSFSFQFQLPDFATLPEIYARDVSSSLQFNFFDSDFSTAQALLYVNGMFTFSHQTFYLTMLRKAFDNDQSSIIEEIKFYPENN